MGKKEGEDDIGSIETENRMSVGTVFFLYVSFTQTVSEKEKKNTGVM